MIQMGQMPLTLPQKLWAWIPPLTNYDLGQNRRIKSNQLDAKLDYYNILNAKSNINITLGTILSRQEFNSSIISVFR